ncbi:MAG TPA: serine/threonine-protein kinase [Acidimicrobiales bacterium]|nr:serine/threonine-protein kinase [Acidimicrobiales bacterium]
MRSYRLESVIGQGGTATVYRARRRSRAGGPVVALKRLRKSGDPRVADRLRREAATLASLDHPNVVRVLDVVPDGTGSAIAMEYAPGGSLATLLARRGRLRPEEVVAVALPLADALATVHRRGLVHGDVKPANILFSSEGAPVLADFGLAGPTSNANPGPGSDGAQGTEGYVDPAVAGGAKAPDERSDVYALGAVCHEMLCGRPPGRHAGRIGETLGSPELAAVLERSLAPRPCDRFPDMEAMGSALRAAATGLAVPPALPIQSAPEALNRSQGLDEAGPPTRPLGARAHHPPKGPDPAQHPSHHRRALVVGAVTASVVAAVGIAAGLLILLVPRLGEAPSRPSPQPCPPVTSPLKADLDGDGCPSAVAVRENILEVEGERYQLGGRSDTVLIGDWDCDGRDTPALYRPSGEVFLFDAWAQEGEALPAASRGEHLKDGHPEVHHGEDGCDRLVVR